MPQKRTPSKKRALDSILRGEANRPTKKPAAQPVTAPPTAPSKARSPVRKQRLLEKQHKEQHEKEKEKEKEKGLSSSVESVKISEDSLPIASSVTDSVCSISRPKVDCATNLDRFLQYTTSVVRTSSIMCGKKQVAKAAVTEM